MSGPVRVGVIDSGVDCGLDCGLAAGSGLSVETICRFRLASHGTVARDEGIADRLGHGTAVSRLICAAAPRAVLLHAQIFDRAFDSAPALVAAGLDWLVDEGARIVNMSFGLRADRQVLGEACRRAGEQGTLLIASSPAQGLVCYPAGYPDVIAVTGDARCGLGEISDLEGCQADFGTWCASPERGGGDISGASAAAAHFSGLAATYLADRPMAGRKDLVARFRRRAVRIGPERRIGS